jgi:hypothetical protein
VPDQILVAFVAKLWLYRFWHGQVLFADFLGILGVRPANGVLDK